jgi:nucleotide-binding universal stress UspA family protein
MYRMIMVPADGSGFDREAIRVALRIAERSEAKVRLVRVQVALELGPYFFEARSGQAIDVRCGFHGSEPALDPRAR